MELHLIGMHKRWKQQTSIASSSTNTLPSLITSGVLEERTAGSAGELTLHASKCSSTSTLSVKDYDFNVFFVI